MSDAKAVVPGSWIWWEKLAKRSRKPIEKIELDEREKLEQRYLREPEATHSDLVYRGYWLMAAQLRIDHAAGRLG